MQTLVIVTERDQWLVRIWDEEGKGGHKAENKVAQEKSLGATTIWLPSCMHD